MRFSNSGVASLILFPRFVLSAPPVLTPQWIVGLPSVILLSLRPLIWLYENPGLSKTVSNRLTPVNVNQPAPMNEPAEQHQFGKAPQP
jgi:hypothetical protein